MEKNWDIQIVFLVLPINLFNNEVMGVFDFLKMCLKNCEMKLFSGKIVPLFQYLADIYDPKN